MKLYKVEKIKLKKVSTWDEKNYKNSVVKSLLDFFNSHINYHDGKDPLTQCRLHGSIVRACPDDPWHGPRSRYCPSLIPGASSRNRVPFRGPRQSMTLFAATSFSIRSKKTLNEPVNNFNSKCLGFLRSTAFKIPVP